MFGQPARARLVAFAVLSLTLALPSSRAMQPVAIATPNENGLNPASVTHPPAFLSGGPSFQATGSGTDTYYVGAQEQDGGCEPDSDCSFPVNSGAQTTIQVVSQQATGCLSYWIGDDSAANIWGQVGYYICNGSPPTAFYQVWSLNTYSVLATGTSPISTGYHQFSMYVASGTTWAYAVDGDVIGTYDMKSNSSMPAYPVQALSEEGYVGSPWIPAQVNFSSAIETLNLGNWSRSQVSTAYAGGCGSDGSVGKAGYLAPYSCWGAEGNLQNSTIPAGSLVVGGDSPPILSGSPLWNETVSAGASGMQSPLYLSQGSSVSATSSPRAYGLAQGAWRAV